MTQKNRRNQSVAWRNYMIALKVNGWYVSKLSYSFDFPFAAHSGLQEAFWTSNACVTLSFPR